MSQDHPLVSVVIPVYNREKFIADALQSIFDQDYEPLEIIVVDKGSTDCTAEIVRSFQKIRYFYQPHHGVAGPAAARNRGLQETKGDLIPFLDSDDIWLPEKTRLQVNYLQTNPDKGFVLCRLKNFIEKGAATPAWLKQRIKNNVADDHLASFIPSTLMARRSVFEKVGNFNTTFVLGEDTDWFLRAREAAVPMDIMPEVLLLRRVHDSNLSHLMNDSKWTTKTVIKIVKASIERKKANSHSSSE